MTNLKKGIKICVNHPRLVKRRSNCFKNDQNNIRAITIQALSPMEHAQ
jgi:hypothetical protein